MKSYREANAFLGGRMVRVIPSIRATAVSRINDHSIALIYHDTPVVTYHDDGTCTLRAGGWLTPTTKARINEYSPARVFQARHEWLLMIDDGETADFFDGIVVDGNGVPFTTTHDESSAEVRL